MKSEDLKLFALFYIKEDETLSKKEKIKLMNYVEGTSDEDLLFFLATGQFSSDKFYKIQEMPTASGIATAISISDARDLAEEKTLSSSTFRLTGAAVSALAFSVAHKINKKYMQETKRQCDSEKGIAKKTCYNKIRRDAIRVEMVSLNSSKTKCQKTKNPETCIKNISKRTEDLQQRLDMIKVF
jgi:hypothetical protein